MQLMQDGVWLLIVHECEQGSEKEMMMKDEKHLFDISKRVKPFANLSVQDEGW